MGDLISDLQAQNMPFMGCQVARECIRGVKHDAACKCARALIFGWVSEQEPLQSLGVGQHPIKRALRGAITL